MNRGTADLDPRAYLLERYRGTDERSRLRSAYYSVRPLLPRRLQLAVRRAYAPVQARRPFPRWPIEPILVEHQHETLRRRLRESGRDRLPIVNFWPEGRRFAVVLTHDVEGPAGVANVPRVLEVERRHGFVSSWNFVAEWYAIPDGVFDRIRAAGGEIGLHGIRHDGRLFRDRASFEAELPKIHHYLREWEAAGFRSPATHRNADWMPELGCLYDSSFPDTDPFEPQAGGCCSIFPFFLDDLVELPITLPQDHTLWEILRDRSIRRWVEKAEWIVRHHGLVNLIVHPDYVVDENRLALYDRFLAWLAEHSGGWHALPREVAAWWRERADLKCVEGADGVVYVTGDTALTATVAYAREADGELVLDV